MKKILTMLVFSVFLVFSGCSTKKGSINSYVEPTYNTGSVKSIAIFPIRNAKLAPSEARQLNKEITQTIHKKNPNIKIIAPSKALRIINDNGIAKEWANFVDDYYTSGIADITALNKLSKALNVDAIFQGQLLNVTQADGDGLRSGVTRVTVSFSIIETKSAKILWEATADGTHRVEGLLMSDYIAPPITESIKLAMDKIKQNIPKL